MTELKEPTVAMKWDGKDWQVYADAKLIAKCQAGVWISLTPGWTVKPNAKHSKAAITHLGATMEYGVPKHHRKTSEQTAREPIH